MCIRDSNKASSYVIQTSNKAINENRKIKELDIELLAIQIQKLSLDTRSDEDSLKSLSEEIIRLTNLDLNQQSLVVTYLSSLNLQANNAMIQSKINKEKLDLEKKILSLLTENTTTYKSTELYKNPTIKEEKPDLLMSTFFSFFGGLMLTILFLLLKFALNPQLVKPNS